jgi:hypothetical protein
VFLTALTRLGGVAALACCIWLLGNVLLIPYMIRVSAEFEGLDPDPGLPIALTVVGGLLVLLFAATGYVLISPSPTGHRRAISMAVAAIATLVSVTCIGALVIGAIPAIRGETLLIVAASSLLLIVSAGSAAHIYRHAIGPTGDRDGG